MNDIIKIENRDGIETVNARDLHSFLESKQDFSNWIKSRIEKYGFKESKDFIKLDNFIEVENSNLKRPQIDYYLTIEMAKEISMVENNEKGKEARQYFIECENKYKSALPKKTLDEQALEVITGLQQRVIEYKQKYEMLIHQNKLYTSTEIAKELNLKSAVELNKILENNKIQYKVNNTWVLTSDYSELNYTSTKQTILENGKIIYDRKWTGAGRDFIIKFFNSLSREIAI